MRKSIQVIALLLAVSACADTKTRPESTERIAASTDQDTLFSRLKALTSADALSEKDSIAVLILPVQASCPSCRSKVITSISRYKSRLLKNHFIVISSNGGRKTINSFFRDEKTELPVIPGRLFLDSTNRAYDLELYNDKPVCYYASGGKVYKKVSSFPATVKEDLREFFSGRRKTDVP